MTTSDRMTVANACACSDEPSQVSVSALMSSSLLRTSSTVTCALAFRTYLHIFSISPDRLPDLPDKARLT